MITGIVYDGDKREAAFLQELIRDNIALRSDDESRISECFTKDQFINTIKEADLNDFCCMYYDKVTGRAETTCLREAFPESSLLLLVDLELSPREYVRPDIRPAAIVLKPADEESIRETLSEFFDMVLKSFENESQQSISVDTKEGVTKVPFDNILYVEANAKKVYIRTSREEYGYYETLDNLESVLPESFFRCHRSYIVNLAKVNKYVGTVNLLYLTDGSVIPVSRSYKSVMREVLK